MSIKPTWPGILKVQSEVYWQVEPETLEVLQSKWLRTPECCFVYQHEETVLGYLLAHAWIQETPPKLFKPLPEESDVSDSFLFIHDLAVSEQAAGKGIGSMLVSHLITIAERMKFDEIRLVSVQDSVIFWRHMGFREVQNQHISSTYGEDATMMRYVLPEG
ncbi:GNAT family N-acetyltransferase [Vibrio ruber]|uniref:GNAT family N-acetyltransferase n=1 Tax=Vibrio ruber TaxID=184755 RepID=UPI00289356FD|nr:GNAT family N-acetyltransferase [Vibrio ruber]WNJ97851.1 GNAT family N-acetyltransferase [Vibrio ruber]